MKIEIYTLETPLPCSEFSLCGNAAVKATFLSDLPRQSARWLLVACTSAPHFCIYYGAASGTWVKRDKFGESQSESYLDQMIMDDIFTATLTPLRHSKWTVFVLMVAYSLALIAGLVGNIFVVAIVIKDPKMRTVTNFFLLNLAVADLLVLTVCLPLTLVSNIYVRK